VKAKTILKEGFRPDIGETSTSQLITEAVTDSAYSFSLPFSRDNVTYFHLNPELPRERLEGSLSSNNSVVMVVDSTELFDSYECYLADMDILNEIIDRVVDGPVGEFSSIAEAASGYEESVTSVSSYEDAVSASRTIGYPELLVVGAIEPSCIVEVFE
jgi:hypothetical protein